MPRPCLRHDTQAPRFGHEVYADPPCQQRGCATCRDRWSSDLAYMCVPTGLTPGDSFHAPGGAGRAHVFGDKVGKSIQARHLVEVVPFAVEVRDGGPGVIVT